MSFSNSLLIISFLIIATWGRSFADLPQITLTLNDKNIKVEEFLDFVESSAMSDQVKTTLFKSANQDYSKYQELKNEWIEANYEVALKRFAYIKVLELYAKLERESKGWKSTSKNAKKRPLSTKKDKERYRLTQEFERATLKPLFEKGLDYEKARETWTGELVKKGYPFVQGESLDDTYFRWLSLQAKRLEYDFIQKQANQYLVNKTYKSKYIPIVNHLEVYDFYEKTLREAEQLLEVKDISRAEIVEVMGKNKDFGVVLNGLKVLDLKDSSLKKFINNEEEFEKQFDQFWNNFDNLLSKFDIATMEQYIETIHTLAKKYNDYDELKKLSVEARNRFIQKTDYNEFVLSELYDMAALSLRAERKDINQELELFIHNMKDKILDIKEGNFEKEDMAFLKMLKTSFNELLSEENYLREVQKFSKWLLMFDAQKALAQTLPSVTIDPKSYNDYKTRKNIESYLRSQKLEVGKGYIENEISKFLSGEVIIYTLNGEEIYNYHALEFIFN